MEGPNRPPRASSPTPGDIAPSGTSLKRSFSDIGSDDTPSVNDSSSTNRQQSSNLDTDRSKRHRTKSPTLASSASSSGQATSSAPNSDSRLAPQSEQRPSNDPTTTLVPVSSSSPTPTRPSPEVSTVVSSPASHLSPGASLRPVVTEPASPDAGSLTFHAASAPIPIPPPTVRGVAPTQPDGVPTASLLAFTRHPLSEVAPHGRTAENLQAGHHEAASASRESALDRARQFEANVDAIRSADIVSDIDPMEDQRRDSRGFPSTSRLTSASSRPLGHPSSNMADVSRSGSFQSDQTTEVSLIDDYPISNSLRRLPDEYASGSQDVVLYPYSARGDPLEAPRLTDAEHHNMHPNPSNRVGDPAPSVSASRGRRGSVPVNLSRLRAPTSMSSQARMDIHNASEPFVESPLDSAREPAEESAIRVSIDLDPHYSRSGRPSNSDFRIDNEAGRPAGLRNVHSDSPPAFTTNLPSFTEPFVPPYSGPRSSYPLPARLSSPHPDFLLRRLQTASPSNQAANSDSDNATSAATPIYRRSGVLDVIQRRRQARNSNPLSPFGIYSEHTSQRQSSNPHPLSPFGRYPDQASHRQSRPLPPFPPHPVPAAQPPEPSRPYDARTRQSAWSDNETPLTALPGNFSLWESDTARLEASYPPIAGSGSSQPLPGRPVYHESDILDGGRPVSPPDEFVPSRRVVFEHERTRGRNDSREPHPYFARHDWDHTFDTEESGVPLYPPQPARVFSHRPNNDVPFARTEDRHRHIEGLGRRVRSPSPPLLPIQSADRVRDLPQPGLSHVRPSTIQRDREQLLQLMQDVRDAAGRLIEYADQMAEQESAVRGLINRTALSDEFGSSSLSGTDPPPPGTRSNGQTMASVLPRLRESIDRVQTLIRDRRIDEVAEGVTTSISGVDRIMGFMGREGQASARQPRASDTATQLSEERRRLERELQASHAHLRRLRAVSNAIGGELTARPRSPPSLLAGLPQIRNFGERSRESSTLERHSPLSREPNRSDTDSTAIYTGPATSLMGRLRPNEPFDEFVARRRHARLRNFRDYVPDALFDSSYENLLRLSTDSTIHRTSSEILNSFSRGPFREFPNPANEVRCPICLDDYTEEEVVMAMHPCGHFFHEHCISQWLQTSHSCPYCRTRAERRPGIGESGPSGSASASNTGSLTSELGARSSIPSTSSGVPASLDDDPALSLGERMRRAEARTRDGPQALRRTQSLRRLRNLDGDESSTAVPGGSLRIPLVSERLSSLGRLPTWRPAQQSLSPHEQTTAAPPPLARRSYEAIRDEIREMFPGSRASEREDRRRRLSAQMDPPVNPDPIIRRLPPSQVRDRHDNPTIHPIGRFPVSPPRSHSLGPRERPRASISRVWVPPPSPPQPSFAPLPPTRLSPTRLSSPRPSSSSRQRGDGSRSFVPPQSWITGYTSSGLPLLRAPEPEPISPMSSEGRASPTEEPITAIEADSPPSTPDSVMEAAQLVDPSLESDQSDGELASGMNILAAAGPSIPRASGSGANPHQRTGGTSLDALLQFDFAGMGVDGAEADAHFDWAGTQLPNWTNDLPLPIELFGEVGVAAQAGDDSSDEDAMQEDPQQARRGRQP